MLDDMNIPELPRALDAGRAPLIRRIIDLFRRTAKAPSARQPHVTRRIGTVLARFALTGAALFAACSAHAGTYQCGGGYAINPTVAITIPGSVITSSADTPVGGWIGNWTAYSKTTQNFWCTTYTGNQLQVEMQGTAQLASPSTMSISGTTYAVFKTGIAGLGVVFEWHPIYNSASMGTTEPGPDVPLTTTLDTTAPVWNHTGPTESTNIGVAIQARYVKIGTIAAGTTLPAVTMAQFGIATERFSDTAGSGWYQLSSWYTPLPFNVTQNATTVPVLGCMPTASSTVQMGTFATSLFKGVGSTVGTRSFAISLTACPAAMQGISYSLSAVNGSVGGDATGVAGLSPGTGAATGVGLLITPAGSSTPQPFNVTTSFSGYKGAAGNYAIPLTAAYYQTSAAVTAGTANTQITFTITYQ